MPSRSRPRLWIPLALAIAAVASYLPHGAPGAVDPPQPAEPPAPAAPDAQQVTVIVDSSAAPDLAEWLDKAATLVKQQHPKITAMLATEGFTPPMTVHLVASKDLKVPGATSIDRILVSADWVRKYPGDVGMVVHELVHVVQQYRQAPRDAGWVREGIADYYRYYHFEPGSPRARFRLDGAGYRQGYQPTAAFFDYLVREHDAELITHLNAAMRGGTYADLLFEQRTGKKLDDLWKIFVESRRN